MKFLSYKVLFLGIVANFFIGNLAASDLSIDSDSTPSAAGERGAPDDESDSEADLQPNREFKYPEVLESVGADKVLVFYRGVHFPADIPYEKKRAFVKRSYAGEDTYAPAVFELMGVSPFDRSYLNTTAAREHAEVLAEKVQDLAKTDPISVKRRRGEEQFEDQRFAFQAIYTNDYDGLNAQLKNPSGQYKPIFDALTAAPEPFTKNPQASTSEEAKHPAKYAIGGKFLGKDFKKTEPDYDKYGVPKHRYVGKVLVIMMDKEAYDSYNPLNVVQGYGQNKFPVHTHFSNNILTEREVSFSAFISGEHVVLDIGLRFPNFSNPWSPYHEARYGFTKCKYNNFKKALCASDEAVRERTVKRLKNDLAESFNRSLLKHVSESVREKDKTLAFVNLEGHLSKSPIALEGATKGREDIDKIIEGYREEVRQGNGVVRIAELTSMDNYALNKVKNGSIKEIIVEGFIGDDPYGVKGSDSSEFEYDSEPFGNISRKDLNIWGDFFKFVSKHEGLTKLTIHQSVERPLLKELLIRLFPSYSTIILEDTAESNPGFRSYDDSFLSYEDGSYDDESENNTYRDDFSRLMVAMSQECSGAGLLSLERALFCYIRWKNTVTLDGFDIDQKKSLRHLLIRAPFTG